MLLMAMAIGAGIGALAGSLVYGAKVALSSEEQFSWKALGAHAIGGLVGGGLFPPLMAGLAAVGLPAAAAYVLAGGIAWGGVWTLAQDAASWGFGLKKGLSRPRTYLTATALGLAASALLLPFAARAVGPGMQVAKHAGTVEAFVAPSRRALAANLVKAEAEFLAYGTLTEGANAGLSLVGRNLLTRGGARVATRGVTNAGGRAAGRRTSGMTLGPTGTHAATELTRSGAAALAANQPPQPGGSASSFGAFAERIHQQREELQPEQALAPGASGGLVESLPLLAGDPAGPAGAR